MSVEWWKEENIPEHIKRGKGSFGLVLVHKDPVDRGIYACKVINLTEVKLKLTENKNEKDCENFNLSRALEEVTLLKRLEHPNVVRYFGYQFEGPNKDDYAKNPTEASIASCTLNSGGYPEDNSNPDYLIIRMELCSGSLESRLLVSSIPDYKEKYLVLEQLSMGLSYIHSHNVIHRDVKPANILVTLNNESNRIEWVKLADFGLAIENNTEKILQGKQKSVGTIKYRGPEINNSNWYCEKTDIFSAGLVFLEVLIGKVGESRERLLKIVEDKMVARNHYGLLSSKTIRLIRRMLKVNVEERLNAEEVLRKIKKLAVDILTRSSGGCTDDSSSDSEDSLSVDAEEIWTKLLKSFPELGEDYIWMDIREELDDFEGRKRELKKLGKRLKNNSVVLKEGPIKVKKEDKLVLIHGLGGNGKTELAIKFMNSLRGRINGVWLRGENEITLSSSIRKLAMELKVEIKDGDKDEKSPVQLLTDVSKKISHTKSGGPWVFVVDNVDKDHKLSSETISILQGTRNSFVLVTSQCPLAVRHLGMRLPLEPLASPDAEEFVRKAMESREVDDDIKRLCRLLGNLPLALQQAVAHIRVQKISSLKGNSYGVGDYIEEYNESVEQQKTLLNETLTKEEQTVYNTINMALNKIRQTSKTAGTSPSFAGWLVKSFFETLGWIGTEEPAPIRLLYFLSYMDPDCIPVNILEAYMKEISEEWTPKLLDECLVELKSRSIIQCESNIIRVHRVVQTIMRISDAELDKEQTNKPPYLIELSNASCSLLDSSKYSKDHLQQAITIWNAVNERVEVLKHGKIREMPGKMARQMLMLIQYIDALKHTEESLPILQELFGASDPRTALKMKHWRGCALGHSKDLPKSLQILKETHEEMCLALGEDDDYTLSVNDSRAMILKDNGLLEEAEQAHRRCIELYVKKSGQGMSPRVAAFTQNMGMTLAELWKRDKDESKINEAISNYKSVVDWSKSTNGDDHPDTLTAMDNLAFGYSEKGDRGSLEMAKEIYQAVDCGSRRVFGDQHSYTLVSNVYLARVLKELGEKEQSLELFAKLLEPLKRVIGPEHHFYREAAEECGFKVTKSENTVLRL